MRRIVVALVVIVVLVGLAFVAYQFQIPTVTVEMRLGEGTVHYKGSPVPNYLFSPASITIKQGTVVRWINKDPSASHTVTWGDTDVCVLSPNAECTHTMDLVGTFRYYCKEHPWMNGTVTVTP